MSFEKWNAAHGSFDLDQRNREFSAWEAGRAECEAKIAALKSERDALRALLYELVDEFRSGASEYDIRGAEHWESAKADVYNECADKLRAALSTPASREPARKP